MPDRYLLLSPALEVVEATDGYLAATGTQRDALLGRHASELFADRPEVPAAMQRAIASGVPDRTNIPIAGAGGGVELLLHRLEDATDVVALRRESDHFRRLLDTAPDAIVIVGSDGRIQLVNVQTEVMFGYSRAELLGQSLELLIPERFRGGHAAHMNRYFSHPSARPMGSGLHLYGRRKDGTELPIEVSLSPQRGEDHMTVSAAIRDTSERRRLDEALREARAIAEAASAAKTDFLSSMSHELRTPLNAILGFAQLLGRDKREPLSERHRERVDHILRGGEHLLKLINDILDLSRIEAGAVAITTEPVHVGGVLHTVERTLEPIAARNGITLALEPIAADVAHVTADPTRFAQILMNLGSNAIKYNRPGGAVRFVVSQVAGHTVRVTVTDTGIGVPVEKQAKLFQPFQRAGQETGPIEGTGIGLVITKRLAALMHGTVGFHSVPGVGSEFWVELPATATAASALAGPLPDEPAPPGAERDQLVLYVEDNPANVEFIRDLTSSIAGIELVTVPTAELGIELARARRPALVLMDINLPGMSGLDALGALKAHAETRAIPVIALTAAASARDREQGLAQGFFRYCTKPVQVDELIAAIQAALAVSQSLRGDSPGRP